MNVVDFEDFAGFGISSEVANFPNCLHLLEYLEEPLL